MLQAPLLNSSPNWRNSSIVNLRHITMLLKEINKNHNIINDLVLFVVDGPEYPHSHSSLINRHGKVNSMQRYCCKSCLKTFKATTGISLARLHYKE